MAESKKPVMASSKPYLLNALYEWICDNNCTPYILIDAYVDGVEVPQDFVKDGQIVLNVSPTAVVDLVIDKDGVRFNGRFAGIPMNVLAPLPAILGIYTKENGQGMMFDREEPQPPTDAPPKAPKLVSTKKTGSAKSEKPSLKIVK